MTSVSAPATHAQVDSFHQTAHFLTSSHAHQQLHPGQIHPRRQHPQDRKSNLYFQMGAKQGGFFQTAVAGYRSAHGTLRGGGRLRRKGPNLLVLGRRPALSAASLVLERSGLGEQPRLSRRFCGFRPPHHSPLPGVSRDLLSGASAALQPLQHHRLFPRHPMRKMSRPGKRTCRSREIQAASSATAILNPARFSRDRQMDLCAWCHAGHGQPLLPSFSYLPGNPWTNTFTFRRPIPIRRWMSMATRSTC